MQQASSAQREPSMEEILASIRRIIEDSDAARKQTEAPQPAAVAPAPAPGAAAPTPAPRPRAPVIDVDAFRAELRGKLESPPEPAPAAAAPAVAPAPVQPEPPVAAVKPRTLAEVQAEITRGTRVVEPEPVAAPVATVPGFVAPSAAQIWPEPVVEAEEPVIARAPAPVIAPFEDELPPAPATFAASEPVEDDVPPLLDDDEPYDAPKPAIISERAGRQVAAAFGELSEAFAESRRKSFDEMAEQMLRPMLQDWLDNNLPVLVERLVREEIERVARGD
ncbi:MAG: DUF2497 domain-containing protein [Rhizobiaceae bacterium]